jgi:hypothetical protein
MLNRLALGTNVEWLARLDDDDLLASCISEVTWTYRYHGGNLWFR